MPDETAQTSTSVGTANVTSPAVPADDEGRIVAVLRKLGLAPQAQPAQAAAVDGDVVKVSKAELETLQASHAELVKTREAKRQAEEQALIDKGQYRQLAEQREREKQEMTELRAKEKQLHDAQLSDKDRVYKSTLLERELATALGQHQLVPDTLPILLNHLRDQFQVNERSGKLAVESLNGQPVADAVKAFLGTSAGAAFVLARSQGGVGAHGGNSTTATPNDAAGLQKPPETLDEYLLQKWNQQHAERVRNSPNPMSDLSLGRGGFGGHAERFEVKGKFGVNN